MAIRCGIRCDLLYSFITALLLSIILHYCYRRIRSDWPASYQSLFEDSAYRKALRPVRYMVFRSSPIILASVLVPSNLSVTVSLFGYLAFYSGPFTLLILMGALSGVTVRVRRQYD